VVLNLGFNFFTKEPKVIIPLKPPPLAGGVTLMVIVHPHPFPLPSRERGLLGNFYVYFSEDVNHKKNYAALDIISDYATEQGRRQ